MEEKKLKSWVSQKEMELMEKAGKKEERRRSVSKYVERTEDGAFKWKHGDENFNRIDELSEKQRGDLKATFDLFDKNADGEISSNELREVMLTLGHNPTNKQMQEVIDEVDIDGNGSVSFEEFLDMIMVRKP